MEKLLKFHSFNSVEELEVFLVKDYLGEEVADFQGDLIVMENISVEITSESIILVSPKYVGVAWIITANPQSGWFRLSIIKGCGQPDELTTVSLPEYVKEEVIATLKGEW